MEETLAKFADRFYAPNRGDDLDGDNRDELDGDNLSFDGFEFDDDAIPGADDNQKYEIATAVGLSRQNFTIEGGFDDKDVSAKDATHVIRDVVVRKKVPNGDETVEEKKEDVVEIYPYQAYKIQGGEEYIDESNRQYIKLPLDNQYRIRSNENGHISFDAPHFFYAGGEFVNGQMFPERMKLRAIFREDVVNGLYDVILVVKNQEEERPEDNNNGLENQFRIKLCSSFNHQPKESKSDKQRKKVKKVIEFEYEPTSAVDFNIVRSSFNKASTIILKQNGVEQPPYENVILQDAILPYRKMHNVYENEYGSYKDMNNFLLQPEVRDFTTMYKLCSGGKNALTTDDMKQAIKLIKNNNSTMQCKPMSNNSDVEEYKKAFPKCHRGEAYSGRNTTDCPYFDETVEGARRALGNQDFQDVATQGKAVRWPENYQQAQRFGKVVGKLDSEYIEGSKTISPDDLAFLRRKKRMQERERTKPRPIRNF